MSVLARFIGGLTVRVRPASKTYNVTDLEIHACSISFSDFNIARIWDSVPELNSRFCFDCKFLEETDQ